MAYTEYKNTDYDWLPIVPAHWEKRSIRSITELSNERLGDRNATLLSVYREYGVVRKDSRTDNHNVESENLSNYKLVKEGDLVLNKMKMWQGSLGVSKYEGIVSPAYIVCHMINSDLNPQYLHSLLRSMPFKTYYNRVSYGIRVGQWDMHYDDFKKLIIYIPSRQEQDTIVKYLDWQVSKINKLMATKKKKLALLREVIDREFRNVTAKKCSLVKLKYLFALENDFFIPEAESMYQKAGMYNRGRGIFLREPCPGEELGDSKFQRIARDRLMLSGQFAWEDAVYITQEKDEQGIASHRYYLLKPTCSVSVEYLFAYFLSSEGFFNLQQCSHGSAGRNRPLNIKEVLNLSIPVPNDENDTERLALIIRNYMALQVDAAKENELLYELKMKLISDVVTGQIDVRGIEIPEYEYIEETDNSSYDESDDDIDGSDEEV